MITMPQQQPDYQQLYNSMLTAFDAVNLNYFVMEIVCGENGQAVDGIYREVTLGTERLLGKSREQLLGKSRRQLFGNVSDEFLIKFNTVLKTGQPVRFQGSGALQKYYDVYAWKVADKQVAAIIVDLTEHKKVEEAQRLSEERFSKTFNESPVAISISRMSDGLLTDVNEAYLQIFGFSRQEIIGHTSTELGIFTESNEREELVRILREKGKVHYLEVPFKTKTGKIIDTITSIDTIHVGNEDFMISTILDITEHKKAEEAVTKAKEQYDLLFNSVTEGFAHYKAVCDENGKLNDILVLDINPAGALQSGVSRERQIGKTWRQVWTGIPDSVFDIYNYIKQTRAPYKFEHFSPITNRWYMINVTLIAEEQICSDIF